MDAVKLNAAIRSVENELRDLEARMRQLGIDPAVHRVASEMAAIEAAIARRERQVRLAPLYELAAICRNVRQLREQRRLLTFDPKRAQRIRAKREGKS